MELLLELLLTMVLSVLIAFLLAKIVSVGAPDGDDPDGVPQGDAPSSSPRLRSPKTAAPGSPVGFVGGEVAGEAKAIGESRDGVHADGEEVVEGCCDGCIETDGDRGLVEIVRREGEELVVEGVVEDSDEAGAKELGVEDEEEGGGKVPAAAVGEGTEENLVNVTSKGEILKSAEGLPVREKLLRSDGCQVLNIALSMGEEKEAVIKELDTGKVGTGFAKDGERLPVVGAGDVKVVPYEAGKDVGIESGHQGSETIIKDEKTGSSLNEDDDWEGIEKSDLEKLFCEATAYVGSAEGIEALSKLSNDLQMQLYALHKTATEGPCYESQPLALKVSSRAKWHAWQRLGSMNPEAAMEQYVTLLSDNFPEWMSQKLRVDGNTMEGGVDSADKKNSGSLSEYQLSQSDERKLESHFYAEESDVVGVSKDTEQGNHSTDSLD